MANIFNRVFPDRSLIPKCIKLDPRNFKKFVRKVKKKKLNLSSSLRLYIEAVVNDEQEIIVKKKV